MKIKIITTSTGAPKLTQALAAANGKATAHTATAQELIDASNDIENQLTRLSISKADRIGAEFVFCSGGAVARSYKYNRKVTLCRAVRGASDWFLISATPKEIYANQSGYCTLLLTEKQDALAVAKLRAQYSILSGQQ
jgi:hypothetical protein